MLVRGVGVITPQITIFATGNSLQLYTQPLGPDAILTVFPHIVVSADAFPHPVDALMTHSGQSFTLRYADGGVGRSSSNRNYLQERPRKEAKSLKTWAWTFSFFFSLTLTHTHTTSRDEQTILKGRPAAPDLTKNIVFESLKKNNNSL